MIYGPTASRRLGRSLGVDPVPLKTCDWNCVYCQLGRTSPFALDRQVYVPTDALLAELQGVLTELGPDALDWVTFAGSGEPTLHSDLGHMIREAKAMSPTPVAVITNGSLLWRPDVREELLAADAVMPTLVAADERIYRQINRAHPALTLARHIDGLVAFRQEYAGRLWVEIMLVAGLNDSDEALDALAAVLARVRPDEIHLTLPTRPPSEPWVGPPSPDRQLAAAARLGGGATVVRPATVTFELAEGDGLVDAIVSLVSRHPVAEADLREPIDREAPGRVAEVLAALAADGRAQRVERHGQGFWAAAASRFKAERALR
jgi:wyosine [tRNA(Phe)-imidazoG37] synthetase (radical SAM superfamily)